jgi:hypothetical protein
MLVQENDSIDSCEYVISAGLLPCGRSARWWGGVRRGAIGMAFLDTSLTTAARAKLASQETTSHLIGKGIAGMTPSIILSLGGNYGRAGF